MNFVLAALLLVIASSVANGRGADKDHFGPSLPPYLAHVNKEAYKEFLRIAHAKNLTIAQQKKELERWARKNRISGEVAKYNDEQEISMKTVRRNVARLIKDWLPVVMEKFFLISEDQNQTQRQLRTKLQDLATKHPKAFNVLTFAMQQFMVQPRLHEGKSNPVTEGRHRHGHGKGTNEHGNHPHHRGTPGQHRKDWWE